MNVLKLPGSLLDNPCNCKELHGDWNKKKQFRYFIFPHLGVKKLIEFSTSLRTNEKPETADNESVFFFNNLQWWKA